jgi:hypothetical protein
MIGGISARLVDDVCRYHTPYTESAPTAARMASANIRCSVRLI